ncbi:MAG: hypothetical protein NTX38_15070 [Methylobacter sp.]|nr:hypothetical protein [Methylobacter sp.]
MIKKIWLSLLFLLYAAPIIAAPHYSDALGDDIPDHGASNFSLWVVGIIILFFFIFGGNGFRRWFIKACLFVVSVLAYTWLLIKLGGYIQESMHLTKNGGAIIILLVFVVGFFGPLYIYSKKIDP